MKVLSRILSSILLKNLLALFQNLPKQHRWVIVTISFFLLLLLILPSSNDSGGGENIQVGQRIQLVLPENIVPANIVPVGTRPEQSASSQPNQIKRSVTEVTGQFPSLSNSGSVKNSDILASGQLKSKVKITNSLEQLAHLSWQTVKVRSGDSLALIMKRLGFSAQTTYAVSTAKGDDSHLLKSLNVGDTLRLATDENQQLAALEYPLSKTDTLFINLVADSYQSHRETKQVEIRQSFSYGTINASFWHAGLTAGLSDSPDH